jgi:CheY-like chemotaxis protein
MTGNTEPDDLAACRAAGMATILTKPFPLAELQRALVQAIDPARPASPPR